MNRLRPLITLSWPSFMPQTRTATTRKIKSVPGSSRSMRTTVRNVVRTPHVTVLSMVKTIGTPQVSANSSGQGLQIKTRIGMARNITRRSSSNLISCRQKLPTKNPSMKSKTNLSPRGRLPRSILQF